MTTSVFQKKINNLCKKTNKLFYIIFFNRIRYARMLGVEIGKHCRIFIDNWGSEPFLIEIGDHTTITSGVKILTHNGSACLITGTKGRKYDYKKVKIGNNVFIGVNSIILPGVIIKDKVIIAAGTIVTKSIPSCSIVAGNPAKIIGSFQDYFNHGEKKFVSGTNFDPSKSYRENIELVVDKEFKEFLTYQK